MNDLFSTAAFESAYTYDGSDLGAVWSMKKTVFRVWAPTADGVSVRLYRSGTPDSDDFCGQIAMLPDVHGTWTAEKSGDLQGFYYTYQVKLGQSVREVCDPYARSTGINGKRAMILDLSSTDPKDWQQDSNPNPLCSFTDAVIYELHVRDFTMDESSGIRNKGKYLGLIESGTTTPSGISTGLDHILKLGVTHLHFMPIFDFGSVDEADDSAYNWGYDPVNFNVPEGSYSTNPCDGAVRVRELKQMIKGLHDRGLSVVMDVAYTHVYNPDTFCFNQIVPGYFTRSRNGIRSNGSGCGNDTASERSMVRKYIVDSVCYWANEYHVDGFRFDLAGLLDTETVNRIVCTLNQQHPGMLLYGEGWQMGTQSDRACTFATQKNSRLTPGFAYFNDTFRDAIRGSVFFYKALGFVTGATGIEEKLESCFRGLPAWCCDPCQSVNYISCHDNNTLIDRITLATPHLSPEKRVWMHRLAAVFCITAQGIPFFQAGEEMLRSKPDGKGGYVSNSYCSPDSINSIKWNTLDQDFCRDTCEYYSGLIAFRKAHPSLRMTTVYDILSNLIPVPCAHPQVGAFSLRNGFRESPDDTLFLIFNASSSPQMIPLPPGSWQICIDHRRAGVVPFAEVSGFVTLAPISAMILTKESGKLSS